MVCFLFSARLVETSIGIINDSGKLVIPFKSTSQHSQLTTTLDDARVFTRKKEQ